MKSQGHQRKPGEKGEVLGGLGLGGLPGMEVDVNGEGQRWAAHREALSDRVGSAQQMLVPTKRPQAWLGTTISSKSFSLGGKRKEA